MRRGRRQWGRLGVPRVEDEGGDERICCMSSFSRRHNTRNLSYNSRGNFHHKAPVQVARHMITPIEQAKRLLATRRAWLGEGGWPSLHAQERANVCIECPHNEERGFEELFKGVVAREVKRQLGLKKQLDATVANENRLHVCALCGCWLRLKVHVPLHIARENTPDWQQYPAWCWLRRDELT